MNLLLTSAGLTSDSIAQSLEALAGASITDLAIVFVTTAANTSTEDKSWLTENLYEFTSRKPKSFDVIDIAGLPSALWQKHLDQADVICVGGGDESYVARIFKEQCLKDYLEAKATEKVYMGISAGSIVAGHFLTKGLNVALYGEDCESDEGEGMELYDFMFVPHLNSPYFPGVTSEILASKTDEFTSKVIATDDFTAIALDESGIHVIGDGERWEFSESY